MSGEKQLAIMGEVHFGMRDMSYPAFWFSVSYGEDLGYSSLMVVGAEEFSRQIMEADINDIKQLKGHPCQIEVDDKGYVHFVKILKTRTT